MSAAAPSQLPPLAPSMVKALTEAKGETFSHRGWKWVVVVVVVLMLLAFILVGPFFLP